MRRGSRSRVGPATVPPPGLPGSGRRPGHAWSRCRIWTASPGPSTCSTPGTAARTAIDPAGVEPVGTLLCVHGNPTWSYLWRRLLADAPAGWRVVAVDQLGMGYSERIDSPRVLHQRVDDLARLTDAARHHRPRADRCRGDRRPRLGRDHLARLGAPAPGSTPRRRADQHCRAPAGRVGGPVADPTGPPAAAEPARLPLDAVVRAGHHVVDLAASAASRFGTPSPARTAPSHAGGRSGEFVTDIPFAADHPSHGALVAIADEVAGAGCAGAAALGSARSSLRRGVPP